MRFLASGVRAAADDAKKQQRLRLTCRRGPVDADHALPRLPSARLTAFAAGSWPASLAALRRSQPVPRTLIPYEKFKLDNGLTVIVHTDRKAPIVAVNVWYHVGSKNERPGKTGFAHLFEHLMFQGTEHFNDEYFKPFEQVGATSHERHDQLRPHQLLPERADHGARHGAVDGVRPHGPPARRRRPGAPRRAARRRAEREAPGREPPVRPRVRVGDARELPGGPPVPLDCRSARWRTSTPPRSTTCTSGSAPTTARPTRCSCWPATSTWRRRARRPQQYFGHIPAGPGARRGPARGSQRAPRARAR